MSARVLEEAGYFLYWVASAVFVYSMINHWRIATRRKPVEGTASSEVWFCPYCGNLDIKDSEYCGKCGKPLPESLVFDFRVNRKKDV